MLLSLVAGYREYSFDEKGKNAFKTHFQQLVNVHALRIR